MKFKLGSWPFPEHTPAMLCWIKSPIQVGRDRQWQQKVLFVDKNNQYHEHILPWGMIPTLKLGEVYINGCVANVPPAGIEKRFKFDGNTTCRVVPTDSLKNFWLNKIGAYRKELLWERCVLIESGSIRMWIPCIEIVRTFFAINKQLAYLLLDPCGITRICTSVIEAGCARVKFNKEIPSTSLNRTVVARIAAILHQDHWLNSWRQVWNRSIKQFNDSAAFSQLYCLPPHVKNSEWSARGVPLGNDFFVFEINKVISTDKLPFKSVIYTHPNLTYSSDEADQSGEQDGSNETKGPRGGKSSFGEVGSDALPPSGTSNPLRGAVTVATIEFGGDIKVFKQFDSEKPHKTHNKSSGSASEKQKSEPGESKPVSMNAEAGIGELRAAEFKPIEKLEQVPTGLKPFLGAVSSIPNAIVGCTIERVPDDSPLSSLGDGCRHFALVHIIGNRHDEGYALEIDSSDGLSLSTITFKPSFDTDGLTSAKKLLVECLSKRGHWILEAIKEDITAGYKLAKHSSHKSTTSWGCRLRTKVYLLNRKGAENQQQDSC